MTKWLVASTVNVENGRIEYTIPEKPLIHVCCADDQFGDVRVDIRPEVKPTKVADITKEIPYPDNSFAAAFADFPWIEKWRWNVGKAINEMLRVAPVAYTISPWTYGSRNCTLDQVSVSWRPGINHPILFCRYVRKIEK